MFIILFILILNLPQCMQPFQLAFQRLCLKYDHQFHAHFANFISELTCEHIHTHFRAAAKDLLLLAEQDQWLIGCAQDVQGKEVIRHEAEQFQGRLITGQIPIIQLTKIREILSRRQKRIKRMLDKKNINSIGTSQSSSQPQQTVIFLGQSLQNFTFTKLQSSSNQSLYGTSFCNIYRPPYERSVIEMIAQQNFQKSQSKQHDYLKSLVESTLKDLILQFSNNNSTKDKKKQENFSGQSSTSQALDSVQAMDSQIETVVRAELKKYKIGQLFDRTSINSQRSHMTVRDKAEEFLRNMRKQRMS